MSSCCDTTRQLVSTAAKGWSDATRRQPLSSPSYLVLPQFGRKGRTKSYIAETLYLTENTVRSHAKHLYTKLDVHNKQEFMDRVVRKR